MIRAWLQPGPHHPDAVGVAAAVVHRLSGSLAVPHHIWTLDRVRGWTLGSGLSHNCWRGQMTIWKNSGEFLPHGANVDHLWEKLADKSLLTQRKCPEVCWFCKTWMEMYLIAWATGCFSSCFCGSFSNKHLYFLSSFPICSLFLYTCSTRLYASCSRQTLPQALFSRNFGLKKV